MVHTVSQAALTLVCVLMATSSVAARPLHPATTTTATTTTTFPPQPQLITLTPPVATASPDPRVGNSLPETTEEEQRVRMHDDDHDDNESTDTDPHPSPANPRGHYRHNKRDTLSVRRLGRKGKTRLLKNNSNGKRRDGSGGDADEDWRLWHSQYARLQQWRRCRTLRFGPCPD